MPLSVYGEESAVIPISNAEELARIGTDASYPMDGDYELTADIQLEGNWMPFGGYMGWKGSCNPADANVFSGTFDGKGHVISGLDIRLEGSIEGEKYGQVGLFSIIGSDRADDFAEVKNLIFSNVSVSVDFSNELAAVGTLAGEVNGYARVSNVVVVSGKITVNPSKSCDTVGAGGIVGECRTSGAMGNGNISITDCYNGADINSNGSTDFDYAAGIVGRIAQSACGAVTRCVNTGNVQYEGNDAYGIAAAANRNAALLATVSDCYFLDTAGTSLTDGARGLSEKEMSGGTLWGGLADAGWQAVKGCYPYPGFCFASSAAGEIYLSGLSLSFAEGESAAGVKTSFGLPEQLGEAAIRWSSSNPQVLKVENGQAVAFPDVIGMHTAVTLTATSSNGYQRNFVITVLSSNEQVASFNQGYAQVGEPLSISISNGDGLQLAYRWEVEGRGVVSTDSSYTPVAEDLEKFISVKATGENQVSWELKTYCSELPVVYVDTEDGREITSNTVAKDALIRIQGNAEFNDPADWYEGATTIKGRGNSTWSEGVSKGKKPYKLKLDEKANLLGLGTHGKGTNKHWCLLANIIDHTNIRNRLVNEFSRDIGMEVSSGTTNVVLILNGQYQGLYELCEHVRVGGSRVDVFDWEELADDIAGAIYKADPDLNAAGLKKGDIEDAMEQDMSWVDTGTFSCQGKEYRISDYESKVPAVTGGFLLDMDFRSTWDSVKYISTFQTSNGIPMFFRSPEFARTSPSMMAYAGDFLNAYEAALKSADHSAAYQGKTVHYTDLFDLDSLVQYWLVCEYTNNWDSMKNSTYLYKDLEGKAKMGPAWDYDWAFGNINMYGNRAVFVYDQWHTTLTQQGQPFCEQAYQGNQWNHYLVKDPYFVAKAYTYYQKYRGTVIEDIMKDGGKIDSLEAKNRTAGHANDAKWADRFYNDWNYQGYAFDSKGNQISTHSQRYDDAIISLKQFIKKRVGWFDQQFTSVENLYRSLGNSVSNKITVTAGQATATAGQTTATATVSNSNIKYVAFLVNGQKVGAGDGFIPVSDGKASVNLDQELLDSTDGALNTIEALGADSAKNYLSAEHNFTCFAISETEDPEPVEKPLTGTVTVASSNSSGNSNPGDTLTATVADSNNSGTLSYQWLADGIAITGAKNPSYLLTAGEIGKAISVQVSSSVETGTIAGAYSGKIVKKEDPKPVETPLTGTVSITSSRSASLSYPGDKLTASVTGSNNSGILSYQWYADGTAIRGANKISYQLTEKEIGKAISVRLTSSVETGAISGAYSGKVQKKQPTVTVPLASKVKLSAASKKLQVYQSFQLKATITPKSASQKVTFTSNKPSVASVSKTSGKVTAKAPGTATITAKALDKSGKKAACKITVLKPSLKVSGKTTIKRKKSITFTATAKGLKGKITWKLDAKGKKLLKLSKSSGSKVKLTAKTKTGTAKLTVACGKVKVTKKIKVKK